MSRQAQVRRIYKDLTFTVNHKPKHESIDQWRRRLQHEEFICEESLNAARSISRARAAAVISGDVSAKELTLLEKAEIKFVHQYNKVLDAEIRSASVQYFWEHAVRIRLLPPKTYGIFLRLQILIIRLCSDIWVSAFRSPTN